MSERDRQKYIFYVNVLCEDTALTRLGYHFIKLWLFRRALHVTANKLIYKLIYYYKFVARFIKPF